MRPVENLIVRLDGLKCTGPHRWLAKCPAHDDRSPSLAIRELDDGRVLVHCFAGCSVLEILDVLNLDMTRLFPDKCQPQDVRHPERQRFPASDVLRAMAFETLVVYTAAARLNHGQSLLDADVDRLGLALNRIQSAANMSGICHV